MTKRTRHEPNISLQVAQLDSAPREDHRHRPARRRPVCHIVGCVAVEVTLFQDDSRGGDFRSRDACWQRKEVWTLIKCERESTETEEGNPLWQATATGHGFLDSFQLFPVSDVRYTLPTPLARNFTNPSDRPRSAIEFIKAEVPAICTDRLEAVEIGNELDLYSGNEAKRPPSYGQQQYVEEFLQYSDAIAGNLSLPSEAQFQAAALSDKTKWLASKLFELGLDENNKVKTFAVHQYQTIIKNMPVLSRTFLNHTRTVDEIRTSLSTNLNYVRQHYPEIPFVIGEAGSALGSPKQAGERLIDAVLGTALWEVDWLLEIMTIGVSRVNMNQCSFCNFASWSPVPIAGEKVFAQYFGLAFTADCLGLGRSRDSSPLRVATLYNSERPFISPYADYANGVLDRFTIIDLTEWNATTSHPRPAYNIVLSVPTDVKGAELRILTGGGTNSLASNMTYAGLRYDPENPAGKLVGRGASKLSAKGGQVLFKLQASEAALVTLQR